jgi:acetolactate synthase-1/2/3 large subunit
LSDLRTCATIIAQALQRSGVRYVFGHPGGEVVDLIEAIETCGIRFVLTGHESAAAFMAGVGGRITGIPGVCLSTLGPGACNLVLGVACAYLDRDPLLALSARTPSARRRWINKQNLALKKLFTPITKWSVELNGSATEETICTALAVARRPTRGPVYLNVPAEVAVGKDLPQGAAPGAPVLRAESRHDLSLIRQALEKAKRPIGIVGLSLDAEQDCDTVRHFFAKTGIPYVVTPQAKGVADESGEGFLGVAALGSGDASIVEWLNRSDCLLGVGFDPVESSQDWHLRRPIYSLANGPTGFDRYRPSAECAGNVSALLSELSTGYRGETDWTVAELEESRRRVEAAITPPAKQSARGLSPFHVIRAMRELLPENTIVTTDVGAHKMLLAQAWRAPKPGTFLVSNGLSAMGFGVPAAIAAALLRRDRPVVGLIGDGGFSMMVQELETARRLEVVPLFVVFCDRSLAIIKHAQNARRIPHRGVDFAPVDWAKVAEGFGAAACAPNTLAQLQKAASEWLAHPRLTVLAVPIDESLYAGLSY